MNEIVEKIAYIVNLLNTQYNLVYFDRGLLSDFNKNTQREYPLFYLLPITVFLSDINAGFSWVKTYNIKLYVLQNTGEQFGLDVNNILQSERVEECYLLAEEFIKRYNTTFNNDILRRVTIEEFRGLADFTNYHICGVYLELNIDSENLIDC
ncbi:MAG: hypothetical protein QXW79_04100 [Thermoplasmata archaeon]